MERTVPPLPSLKVLLVEDDPTARLFLREALQTQLGHEVIGEATAGPDMVRLAQTLRPDVVVFDIHLPGLNGLEALRQIYLEQVLAAVAITGDRDQSLVCRALEEHVMAYLVKPVEAHQLGPALQIAWAKFQELQALLNENASLKQNLENRKLIERAKGALMKRYRWNEAEAFRRLQRAAMNQRTTMVDLARDVINGLDVQL